MAKLFITLLVLRGLQLALAFAFIIFWAWSCASGFAVGGGIGEYFLGFFVAIVSLAICGHAAWSFAQKKHLVEHRARYHHARWAIDLAVVVLWLGQILISILVPVTFHDSQSKLGGGQPSPNGSSSPSGPSGSDVVAALGVNFTSLFLVITFFMTFLLLVIAAIRARRSRGVAGDGDGEQQVAAGPGYQPGTETTMPRPVVYA